MKICAKCGVKKPLDQYGKYPRNLGGLRHYCKSCGIIYNGKWRSKNKDKVKQYERQSILRSRYGIDLSYYETLLASQDGKCAICMVAPTKKALAVDHCHSTGKIRGLLCSKCNKALGLLKDSPELFVKASNYLERQK